MFSMKKKGFALCAAIFISFFGSAVNAADRSKPIVTEIHNWSSQVVMAYVISGIFELNNFLKK